MEIRNKYLRVFKEYSLITIGILCFVLGWSVFLVTNNLVGGGVTGVASIIQYASKGKILIGTSYFVLNIALLIAALCTLGKQFGAKTVYAIILASAGLNLFQGIIPEQFTTALAVDNGKLMSTIMGGIFVGVGIGICMIQGGSTGGTDIIALIVNKYRNVSPGRMLLAIDAVIILSSLLVPSFTSTGELVPLVDKITTVVYGFILVTVSSTVTDLTINGSRQSVQICIFSKKYADVSDAIVNDLHRGVTVLDGMGWYTKSEKKVVMVLTRKADLNIFLRTIKRVDPDAFISVCSAQGVYGKGFDAVKEKKKKV